MKKYGVEHFFVEQLEECDDSILSEREKYYIDLFDTYRHGYNATLGGEGLRKHDYSVIVKLWFEGYTIKAISKKIGAHPDVIGRILGDCGVSIHDRLASCAGSNRKMVAQYDMDGNLINLFPSASEAARQTALSQPNISSCCRKENGHKSCGGFKWEYVDKEYSDEFKADILSQYRKVS